MILSLGDLISTQKNNREDNGGNNISNKLCSNPPKHKDTIPQDQYGTPHPQWWNLYILTQSMQPHWRTILTLR